MERKMGMDCPLATNNDYSAAKILYGNNLGATENICYKRRKMDFVGNENTLPTNITATKDGYMMSGDQMSRVNLNERVGTISQSMPTICSNSMDNIPNQMNANGVRFSPGIRRQPANVFHVVNQDQRNAAPQLLPYGGFAYEQTPPPPLQLHTIAYRGWAQQSQPGSVNYIDPNRDATFPLQMENERIRYQNDQNQMIQQQRQNMVYDPVGYPMVQSRAYMTAMRPSNYPIEHIAGPLHHFQKQQDPIAYRPTISCNEVQCENHTWQPWPPNQTYIVPNMIAPLTPRPMSMQYQLVQSAHTSSHSQPNSSPRTSTSILDLNDDCLIEICQQLNKSDWFRLRESHKRFACATEYCYNKLEAEKSFEFDFKCWSEDHGIGDLVKILEYFGNCMTRVRIDEFFTRYVREKCISQSFLAERLKNVRLLRLHYAGHDELEFLSALELIQEFELKGFLKWMPLHVHWSKLIQLNVFMEATLPLKWGNGVEWNDLDQLIAFLKKHRGIQKLRIIVIRGRYDKKELCETIATQSQLIELDLGKTCFHNEHRWNLSSLNALRTLKIGPAFEENPRWFGEFKNLKSLSLIQKIEPETVCEILERVPSLIHLEIAGLELSYLGLNRNRVDDPEMDNIILGPMIEKRKLSPNCESELLCIYIAYLWRMGKVEYYAKPVRRCEKYVKFCDWKEGRELYRNLNL